MFESEFPEDVLFGTEQLTQLARNAIDPDEVGAYRSVHDDVVGEYEFRA